MTIHTIDLCILAGYLLAVIVSGLYLARLAAKNIDSYFLGGRRIPWYMLGISNASGMFDITGTMWTVGILFIYGLKSLWLPWLWPSFNQIFLMIYLATWMRRSRVVTGAEWLGTRFSPGAGLELSHIATVLFAVVTVVGMIAYAFEGIGKFAEVFFPWDLSPNIYATIVLAITTLYVTVGGMYSVVLTDLIQFAMMTIVSIWVGVIAIRSTTAEEIAAAVPEGWGQIGFGWQLNLDWTPVIPPAQTQIEPLYELFGVFFMLVVFKGILASMAGPTPGYDMQRVLAARNSREAAFVSGMVSPILLLPRYFLIAGVTVLALVNFSDELLTKVGDEASAAIVDAARAPDIAGPDDSTSSAVESVKLPPENQAKEVDFEQVLPFIISKFMPVGLVGLMLAGLLAAFMSTFDSTVNAGAAYLVNDLYKRYVHPNASGRAQMRMSYVCSLLVVLAGILLGLQVQKIDTILKWITAGLYGGYIAPNFLKWYWWRLNGAGYFAGMLSGTALALAQIGLKDTAYAFLPREALYAFPYVLVISGVCTVVVSLVTRPESDQTLMAFYRSVRPWGFWGPVHRMCETRDGSIKRNDGFSRDATNCVVGTIWQTSLAALPVYVVIRDVIPALVACGLILVSTIVLKFNWYDRLERNED